MQIGGSIALVTGAWAWLSPGNLPAAAIKGTG